VSAWCRIVWHITTVSTLVILGVCVMWLCLSVPARSSLLELHGCCLMFVGKYLSAVEPLESSEVSSV